MNKTIKFRVWHLSAKQFLYYGNPDIEYNDGYGMYLVPQSDYSSIKIGDFFEKSVIFQQFTGAVDKNGKEIYDGDIVKVKRSFVRPFINNNQIDYKHIESDEEVGYIIWGWNSYKWLVSYEHIRYDDIADFNGINHRHEVVGNICENPELVKYQW